jgi:hypothetical protein
MMSSAGFSVNESFADPGFGTLAADFEQVTAIRFGANDPNQANHQVRKINKLVTICNVKNPKDRLIK